MRCHIRHHPLRLTTVPGDHLRPNRRRWQLRVRFDAVDFLLNVEFLDRRGSHVDGRHDRGLHLARQLGPFPAMGKHVPSAVERRSEINRGTLLLVGVERGRKEKRHALSEPEVRRE